MTLMIHTTPTAGRARPTPRHGGAAGRRHADHPEARRRLYQRQHPPGLRSARCGAWTPGGGPPRLTTPRLAVYLGELFEAGRAPATAALAVAAVRFRAKLAGQPAPAGEATARVLGGYRRTAADRGRGQAAPLRADGLAAILATAARPRTDGRGVESHTTAHRRGRLDAVIASLLFMGGLRRSEVAALRWADVSDASDGDGVLLTVRTSKTNQEGDAADVRYLKNGAAKAIRTLRAARRRRRTHGSGGRVVAATDSAPLHRRRPRRRHRGARDGAQWPGRARVRTDGARRVHHGSHAGRQLENRPHGRPLLGRRDRRTRGRRTVFVKAGTGGRHDSTTASIEPHFGMNARCRVTGSRTVEPHQHHSTQEHGPSLAWRPARPTDPSIRSETSATR